MAQEVKSTTFVAADGVTRLVIQHRNGKEGHHVSASLRRDGAKAQLGCRTGHADDASATKQYEVLLSTAKAGGWKAETSKGDGIRNAFQVLPKAK